MQNSANNIKNTNNIKNINNYIKILQKIADIISVNGFTKKIYIVKIILFKRVAWRNGCRRPRRRTNYGSTTQSPSNECK